VKEQCKANDLAIQLGNQTFGVWTVAKQACIQALDGGMAFMKSFFVIGEFADKLKNEGGVGRGGRSDQGGHWRLGLCAMA